MTNREAMEILKVEAKELMTNPYADGDRWISGCPILDIMAISTEAKERPEVWNEEFKTMVPNDPLPDDCIEE